MAPQTVPSSMDWLEPSVVMPVVGTAGQGGRRAKLTDFSTFRLNSSLKLPWLFKIVIPAPAREKGFGKREAGRGRWREDRQRTQG